MLIPDIRWESHGNTILSGPSESGKTSLLDKILRNKNKLFKEGANKRFILYYLSEQPIYEKWAKDGLITYKSKGTPSIEDFLETIKFYAPSGAIIFFDDLAGEIKTNLRFYREVWLVHSHHLKLCSFLILHNIFTPGLRELSLNSHKFILMHNPRDSLSISTLSKQSFPGKKNFLPSIYKKLAERPYSYLCLNFHQNTPPILRGRFTFSCVHLYHFLYSATTNWFKENSDFVMAFQEGSACSPSPYKCLHLISDELFQSLIEKTGNSCAAKCGDGSVEAGSKTHIENNYFGGDNGDDPSGPHHPPHNPSTDNGANDPETMTSPPPPAPPKPPTDPPPSNPETNIPTPPESMAKPPNSDIPTDVAPSQVSINEGDNLEKERRQNRKIVRDKKRRRRLPYKAIQRIKKGEKVSSNPPPNSTPDTVMDSATLSTNQLAVSSPPSQPLPPNPHQPAPTSPNHHPPIPPFAPKPPSAPPSKPKPSPHPKFTKKEMEILKIKDKQMRERETVYLSSSDDEGDVIMSPRSRSPSPQSLIPKPKFKMAPPKISIGGDASKKDELDDEKPKLKKIEPDLPGWISIYDGMERPAHTPADVEMTDVTSKSRKVNVKKTKPTIRVRTDLLPPTPADVEMTDAKTKVREDGVKRLKSGIRVRKDLYPPADAEMRDISTKSKGADVELREKKEKKITKVIKKVKPNIKVRKDLYARGRGKLANERNIHSRINIRTDIFKKSSDLDKEQAVEMDEAPSHNIHDDSVEYIDLDEIPIFPPPINYSVKKEVAGGVKKARPKLVAKRVGHHEIKSKSLLGKHKSILMGKKIPPKMKKLNVGEKRKAPNAADDKKKQKNSHQSFIKLWNITKME